MKTAKQLMALAERGRKLITRPANEAPWFRVVNADGGDEDRAEMFIYGAIGDFWGEDDVTPSAFMRELRSISASTIDLHINSPGGFVFDGIAIHAALLNHAAAIEVHIDGVAASAASFVAMAGDTISIEKPAKMMIHDAAALTIGNADDHRESADLLDELSDTIAGIYADRAGGTVEQWREAMKIETWYGSAEAIEAGLADRISNDSPSAGKAEDKASAGAMASAGGTSRFAAVAAAGGAPAPATARGSQNPKQGRNPAMTIDEIMAAMRAITDGAKGRNLTDAEVKQYEALEQDLAEKRTAQIRERQTAYETPVTDNISAAVHVSPAKEDDGLDKAFENYMRTGRPNADIADLRVTNAQGTTPDTAGGFTVPDTMRQKLQERLKAFGGVATAVEEITTAAGEPMRWPTLDDTANSGVVAPENTAPASGGADLVFGEKVLGAFRYVAPGAGNLPLRVSLELLQDSAFDIQGLVERKLGERIARAQAVHWVSGPGTTAPAGLNTGTSAPAFTSAGITYAELVDAVHEVDPAYRMSASWTFNDKTLAKIEKIVDTTGRPILNSSTDGISGGPENRTLLGYPVVVDQAWADYVDGGTNKWGAFGDLRAGYVIRRVQDMTLIVNPYSRANEGQIEYVLWARADGTPQDTFAYRVLINAV